MSRLLLCALVIVPGGCSSCESGPSAEQRQEPPAEPFDAPAGLLAEVIVPRPAALYQRSRSQWGVAGAPLPVSLPMLVAMVAGLPPAVAGRIDGQAPLVGVLVRAEARRGAVVGARVASGRELLAELTAGGRPPFEAVRADHAGLMLLRPSGRGDATPATTIGIIGDTLLIGLEEPDLHSAGPYAAWTLARRAVPSEDLLITVPRAALAGPAAAAVRDWWRGRQESLKEADARSRAERGGRAPDFGEPAAVILALASLVDGGTAVLESSEEIRLAGDLGEGGLEVRLELEPAATGAAVDLLNSLPGGDLRPLLALPSMADAVVMTRLPLGGARGMSAHILELLRDVLGNRLAPDEGRRLAGALETWSAGLDDRIAAGILSRSGDTAYFLEGSVADPARLRGAVEATWELLKIDAVRRPLEAIVGELRVRPIRTATGGASPSHRMALESGSPGGRVARPRRHEVAWRVEEDSFAGVLASDGADEWLEILSARRGSTVLGADPFMARVAKEAENRGAVTMALAVRAPAGLSGGAPPTHSLLTLGRSGGPGGASPTGRAFSTGLLRFHVPDETLARFLRTLAGR